jgi:hypothetical protein
LNTTDEVYEKLEELRLKFQYEIENADNLINENILSIGKKLDQIINQYYSIRTKLSVNKD